MDSNRAVRRRLVVPLDALVELLDERRRQLGQAAFRRTVAGVSRRAAALDAGADGIEDAASDAGLKLKCCRNDESRSKSECVYIYTYGVWFVGVCVFYVLLIRRATRVAVTFVSIL